MSMLEVIQKLDEILENQKAIMADLVILKGQSKDEPPDDDPPTTP
jgi:hypothetical protein